jgi:hypothetical protein
MVVGLSPLAGTFTDKTDVFGKFLRSSRGTQRRKPVDRDRDRSGQRPNIVVLSHHTGWHGGAQLDAHGIDVYAIRGGRVAEARSTSIEPCATGAFYVDESLDRAIHRPSSGCGDTLPRWHGGQAAAAHERH